jgi:hypothetical protein
MSTKSNCNKKDFWEEEYLRVHSLREVLLAEELVSHLFEKGFKQVTLSVVRTKKSLIYRLEGERTSGVKLVKQAETLDELEGQIFNLKSKKLSDLI